MTESTATDLTIKTPYDKRIKELKEIRAGVREVFPAAEFALLRIKAASYRQGYAEGCAGLTLISRRTFARAELFPELLSALEAVLPLITTEWNGPIQQKAKQAIAKAKGEANG